MLKTEWLLPSFSFSISLSNASRRNRAAHNKQNSLIVGRPHSIFLLVERWSGSSLDQSASQIGFAPKRDDRIVGHLKRVKFESQAGGKRARAYCQTAALRLDWV
jgi:hypothetical protein